MPEPTNLKKLIENAITSATALASIAGSDDRQISGEGRLHLATAAATLLDVAMKAHGFRLREGDDLTK